MRSKLTYRSARRDAAKKHWHNNAARNYVVKRGVGWSFVAHWRELLPEDAALDVRHTDLKRRKRTA